MAAVARLHATWRQLPDAVRAQAAKLRTIGDLGDNFRGYRRCMKHAQVCWRLT